MKKLTFYKKPSFRYATTGFAFAIIGYSAYSVGTPVAHEFQDSFAMKEFKQYGVVGTYRHHFFSFIDRMNGLANLESENENLKAEMAKLDQKQTLEESSKAERELASMNEVLEKKVKEQAGSNEAHLPQVIGYQVPAHLVPSELYSLSLAYFRKQEYEKTVTILAYLFKLPDDRRYQTAENYLIGGISWYHLKNYSIAEGNIALAKKGSLPSTTTHRQAMLWDAMTEKASGKEKIAQTKLLKFIGDYPHSVESAWINGSRNPARVEEVGHEGFHSGLHSEEKNVSGAVDHLKSPDAEEPKVETTEQKEADHEAP